MRWEKILSCLAAAIVFLATADVLARNAVIVESKVVEAAAKNVTVGVYLENDQPLSAIVLPFELRGINPSSFIVNSFSFTASGRVGASDLLQMEFMDYSPIQDPQGRCGGVMGPSWSLHISEITPEFFVSPSAMLWTGIRTTGQNFAVGEDDAGEPSFVFTFDVTNVQGAFVIDTCCIFPSNRLVFAQVDAPFDGIYPMFQRGIISISEPIGNLPPVAKCADVTIYPGIDDSVDVSVSEIDDGSFDSDWDQIELRVVPSGPYPVGETPVHLIVSDGTQADTCESLIRIEPNRPPVARCIDVTCRSEADGYVHYLTADSINNGSHDPDGDPLNVSIEPEGPFPVGDHAVAVIASDGKLADTCLSIVTVVENHPPVAVCSERAVGLSDGCRAYLTPSRIDGGSYDPDGDDFNMFIRPFGYQPIGIHDVWLIVSDGVLSDSCLVSVLIGDTTDLLVSYPSFIPYDITDWPQYKIPDVRDYIEVCESNGDFTITQVPPAGWFIPHENNGILVTVDDEGGNHFTCTLDMRDYIAMVPNLRGGHSPVSLPLDILPDECPNVIYPSVAGGYGKTIRAALLGTAETSVEDLEPGAVRLAGVRPSNWMRGDIGSPSEWSAEEPCGCASVVRDGLPDYVFEFPMDEVLAATGSQNGERSSIPVIVSGFLENSGAFTGGDCISIASSGAARDGSWELEANYPNPFNASTVIRYSVGVPGRVRIDIYDVLGRHVRRLIDAPRDPGRYSVTWDGTNSNGDDVATGVYFYRLQSGDMAKARKMIVLR